MTLPANSAEPARLPLQAQLDEITANTRALVPPDRLAGTERIIEDLHASGQSTRILAPGATIPAFALRGSQGKVVRSHDLLALGFLVIKFFRGRWDPYDITELQAWQELQPELRRHRALGIGISPQTQRQNDFTVEQHRITFPLLSDPGCKVAESFGLTYTIPPASQSYLRSMLINLPFMNGEDTWKLPLPATYLVSPQGRILFAEAYADHRKRPEPATVMGALTVATATTN